MPLDGPAGGPRLLAVPDPRQHRRAAPPDPPPPRLQRAPDLPPQRGSCEETFGRADRAPASPATRCATPSARCEIELVLTAHPTEIVRRTLLQKHDRIAGALAVRDRARPDARGARDRRRDAAPRDCRRAGRPTRVRRARPTPLDEVRGGLVVFEQTLWDALPRYLRELDRALTQHTGRACRSTSRRSASASWIGGDRDGNPNVTPDVTRQAVLLGALDGRRPLPPRGRRAAERAVAGRTPATSCGPASATTHEPYRALLRERARAAARDPQVGRRRLEDRATQCAGLVDCRRRRTSISRSRPSPSRCGSAIARCARPATP